VSQEAPKQPSPEKEVKKEKPKKEKKEENKKAQGGDNDTPVDVGRLVFLPAARRASGIGMTI
jgi:hypothetical protein